MKKLLSIIIFLTLFILFSPSALANSNFSTTYNVTYQVSSDQSTKVIIDVDLKNKTTNYYAASYEIKTGFSDIDKIKASDANGALAYDIDKKDSFTTIKFDFNENVVGVGNSQKFRLEFLTNEIANNFGNIWEVNIPGVSDQNTFNSFKATVIVPSEFGPATFIKPRLSKEKTQTNILEFTKKELGNSGISISYGDNQIYEFDLTYHLKNNHLFPIDTEIAIPSNNNYQEVLIDDITPKPSDVYIDEDGNWLAKYKLKGSEDLDIRVKGKAKILYKPKKDTLSNTQRNIYLKADEYWEVDDPAIKKLANELKTPENIYDYIVENLTYDAGRVKESQIRAGAVTALKENDSAVCLEFTDLFVTLARSAGIPARAVEGWANTTNSSQRPLSIFRDVLHAWPQYWDEDKSAWIMVDPTWGNTTNGIDYFNVFDFDHLTFVIKGVDSNYPIPAGGYKYNDNINDQDVSVTTSIKFNKENAKLDTTTQFSKNYIGGLPVKGKITIYNDSPFSSSNQTITLSAQNLEPNSQDLFLDKIPPYGKKIINVEFSKTKILTNDIDNIKITIGNDTFNTKVTIIPFYKSINFYLILGGIAIGSITITIFIIARRSGRLHIPRRQ